MYFCPGRLDLHKKVRKVWYFIILALAEIYHGVGQVRINPSNNRDWQKKTNLVTLQNVAVRIVHYEIGLAVVLSVTGEGRPNNRQVE